MLRHEYILLIVASEAASIVRSDYRDDARAGLRFVMADSGCCDVGGQGENGRRQWMYDVCVGGED